MVRRRVSDLFVDTLAAAGVQRIYGIPGDSLNGLTDALRSRPEIRWVHVRHEETAAFAAGAEAQLTGRLAVCAGSCGPGNLHLINGLFDAHRSRAPVLAIAAQIPSTEIGSEYFQETHPERLFRECSYFDELLAYPETAGRLLEQAIRTATARRGVSVLVVPGDVLLAPTDEAVPSLDGSSVPGSMNPSPEAVDAAAALLNEARRITIFAGAGCAGAHDELIAFARALGAPIVHTLRGKEHVEYDNPFDVGLTGLLGFASGYQALQSAEVVVLAGTDFPYRQFYPESARYLQIDARAEQLGRRHRVDLAIVGDVRATFAAITPRLRPRPDSEHLDRARAAYVRAREGLDDLARPDARPPNVHPQYLTRVVSEKAPADAIFTCDVGTPTVWAARYLAVNGRRRLLGSFWHGSMANALPQAIGAQLAHPDRTVIALCGDGGLTMLLGDLLTLVQEKLPVKVVVYRNDALAFVGLEMEAAGFLDYGVDFVNPDFAAVAKAAGLSAEGVRGSDELPGAVDRWLAEPGPALLEVPVDRQELVLPPRLKAAEIKGFGLFLARAVLSGRGTEVLDLARVNLWR